MNWELTLKILQGLSYLSSILGVISVAIAIVVFLKNQKLQKQQEDIEANNAKNKRVKNSIDVLRSFATNIIPNMNEQEQKWPEIFVQSKGTILKQINHTFIEKGIEKKLNENELPQEIVQKLIVDAKMTAGISDTLNNLEQLSIYMNYGLVEDDLMYPVIHHVFLNFIDKHNDVLSASKSDDAPFANIQTLYDNWSKRNKMENIDKQREQLDNEKKKLQDAS
ncbi:DUF4760 domain-containing protein [Leuconostoc lactis]